MNRRSFFSFLALTPIAALAEKPARGAKELDYQVPNLWKDDELLMARVYRVGGARSIPRHWRLDEKKLVRLSRGEEMSVYLHDVWITDP